MVHPSLTQRPQRPCGYIRLNSRFRTHPDVAASFIENYNLQPGGEPTIGWPGLLRPIGVILGWSGDRVSEMSRRTASAILTGRSFLASHQSKGQNQCIQQTSECSHTGKLFPILAAYTAPITFPSSERCYSLSNSPRPAPTGRGADGLRVGRRLPRRHPTGRLCRLKLEDDAQPRTREENG